ARRPRAAVLSLTIIIALLFMLAVAAWVLAARVAEPGFGWLFAGLAISLAALAPLIVFEPRDDGRLSAIAEMVSLGAALVVVVAVLVGG
ncbi:MAG: hypothetical protein AB7U62_19210, partial [Pseudolabrys sp.]